MPIICYVVIISNSEELINILVRKLREDIIKFLVVI